MVVRIVIGLVLVAFFALAGTKKRTINAGVWRWRHRGRAIGRSDSCSVVHVQRGKVLHGIGRAHSARCIYSGDRPGLALLAGHRLTSPWSGHGKTQTALRGWCLGMCR